MRICKQISTGKIIEMQSDATAGTLISNAIASGFAANDIVEEIISQEQYKARMEVQEPQQVDLREAAIEALLFDAATKPGAHKALKDFAASKGIP